MKCLVLGYGYMGKIRYRVLQENPFVSSVRVFDPHLALEKELPAEAILHGEKIPWKEFDAVFVCTPNNVTAKFCIEALKEVGHVFSEKPPGRNYEELCVIAEAAKARPDSTLSFGFNHRLHPVVQTAKTFIGDEGLGKVLYIKGTYGKSGGKNFRENWRNEAAISGGGILLDQGIHMLDIFQHFVGPLDVVEGLCVSAFWKCNVEDNAFLLMKSKKNVPAFLHSSATLWKHTFQFEIGCEKGYLKGEGLLSKTGSYGREQLLIGRRQFEDEAFALGNPREEIIYFDKDESWEKEVEEFISAVREKRPVRHGTLDEALQVMRIVRDVYRSAEV